MDQNLEIPENNWLYSKSVKAAFEVNDPSKTYNVFFKIRNTNDYRYANLYLIFRIKGPSYSKSVRHQFQLASPDGTWLGKGSADVYINLFPLLKQFTFPQKGSYEIEIEQNMRDNPLIGVSDIGIQVEESLSN